MLCIVDSYTKYDTDGKLLRYFIPKTSDERGELPDGTRYCHYVSGSDGAALRGLERKGLIRLMKAPGDYFFAITDSGRALLERLRQVTK